MIQQTLYNALKPLVSGRCFYEVIPETHREFPVIVYQFPNISPNLALEEADLDDFTVQIDVYSPDADDIFNLRKQIFKAVSSAFEFATREIDFSDYEPETKLHRRMIQYHISYED
ncbi:hypothetical protein BMT54_06490 [Pasteurellaceae bacterium 15-036681]|nr:hypothetical protein BMT54_06490 [Pasteurellaceae bacterium 15-036681]